jgi:hypothetical protein
MISVGFERTPWVARTAAVPFFLRCYTAATRAPTVLHPGLYMCHTARATDVWKSGIVGVRATFKLISRWRLSTRGCRLEAVDERLSTRKAVNESLSFAAGAPRGYFATNAV